MENRTAFGYARVATAEQNDLIKVEKFEPIKILDIEPLVNAVKRDAQFKQKAGFEYSIKYKGVFNNTKK